MLVTHFFRSVGITALAGGKQLIRNCREAFGRDLGETGKLIETCDHPTAEFFNFGKGVILTAIVGGLK